MHEQRGDSAIRPAPQPYVPAPKPPPARRNEEIGDLHAGTIRKGTIISDRYRIEGMIGRGGMGTVYAVAHVNTGEQLALKVLNPALAENEDAVSRFRTEARAPVSIACENVVRVVDADVSEKLGQVPYMVMERLEGHDLRSELKRRGALPAGEVVLYLRQVALALDKAHRKGIIHRDLKPANMYVVKRDDGSPLVKVLDFGIAKLTDDAAQELTVAGQVFGTPWYMAPEQARGDLGAVCAQTDLWALGLIAYQLLTGRNYWTADGMAALVGQICYEPMPPPSQSAPHLGPLFDMWFTQACNRDPSQRYPTAAATIDQLAQALGVNQTGAGITTGSDSNLQFHAQSLQSGSHPAIPGTSLGSASLDGTDAPFYNTQQPAVSRRSSSMTAVFIGVTVALILVGGGVGVYMALPDNGVPTSAALDKPSQEAKPELTVASETPAVADPDDTAGDEAEEADKADSADAKEDGAPAADASKSRAAPQTPRAAPKGSAAPKTQKTAQPKTVAPKVDTVVF